DLEHHVGAVVVGVQRVEHVARGDVEPTNLVAAAAEGHPPDPGGVIVAPCVRKAPAGHGGIDVEGDRKVVHHHPALGDGAVVHHRAVGDLDRLYRADHRVGPGDDVLKVGEAPEVRDGVQVAGGWVHL